MARLVAALVLVFVLAQSAGCIENMGDLKEALGATAPPPPPPVFLPPVAKAQANATSVLVGEPVRFTSEGAKDAQSLPLDFAWVFGDGATARGPVVTHAFAAPGEHRVRLVVTNTAGLSGDATLVVRAAAADRAPSAALRVLDAAGVATLRAQMDEPLRFEALASDPEEAPLAYEWDFGDGSTARCDQDGCRYFGTSVAGATGHDARAEHAYAAPGVYDVRLAVTDRAGNVALDSARVSVDATWRSAGAFAPAAPERAETSVVVARAARSLDVTLSFGAGLGANDLEVVVLDAQGAEVARSAGEAEPGAQGQATRTLALRAADLAGHAPGAWVVQVVRERGLSASWSLEVVEKV